MDALPRTDELRVRQLSLDDWIALDEDEGEWVDGWLVEEEVASRHHELVVAWLIGVLGPYVFARGGGVFASNLKLRLSRQRGRKPDISVLLAYRPLTGDSAALENPPDIVIEVVSPQPRDQRRDRIAKFAEYASFGARYYWIVDPQARTLEIFELAPDGRYSRAAAATEGSLAIPGCEGLSVDLSALWAELDRWSETP